MMITAPSPITVIPPCDCRLERQVQIIHRDGSIEWECEKCLRRQPIGSIESRIVSRVLNRPTRLPWWKRAAVWLLAPLNDGPENHLQRAIREHDERKAVRAAAFLFAGLVVIAVAFLAWAAVCP